ncbi:hypothetical protein C2S53_009131 [Perilla frutescens var. hirtella]|uniref:Uncharacterized protein n=1 Tax=Perilla frutescens var. hirtella TaxID=608512 RepID=A0AAD4P9V8_PERFH|nr:hypothetical protein C2S53_009131 [Perilla frutescens var. hirtella]
MNEAANKFQVCRKSVSRVWATAKKQAEKNQPMHIEAKENFTRTKRVVIDLELISNLALNKRGNIKTLAHGINVKKSTVGRSMHNTVHIDEKWFYMKKDTHRVYMTPEEPEPHRSSHFSLTQLTPKGTQYSTNITYAANPTNITRIAAGLDLTS